MAKKTLHALDFLAKPDKYPVRPVCVVFGDDPFLRRQVIGVLRQTVLGGEDAEFSLTVFEGRSAEMKDVLGDLATLAMFGGGQRLVLVEDADDFVSRNRPTLEDYVAAPCSSGVLVLEVRSWPSNTRLYKAVAGDGLTVDCNAPPAARLGRWLGSWARQRHNTTLDPAAVEMLLEMVGPELGLLDQELAKLALTAEKGQAVGVEQVGKMVGGWRAKTTWEMLDRILEGKAPAALEQLDRLLAAGESPIGILGQISATLRRLAAATRLIVQAEAAGRRIALRQALEQAGVRSFLLKKTEGQLRQIGRHRAGHLYDWLLKTDLDLKGGSALPPRMVLETLILRLAAPELRQPSSAG
ncbi:MAG: DNA polymerase III subunit delta [Planctomycetes bacterium]|nr:DNA polymerase III subunit delta [Planctomycetota bacterium]